MRDSVAPVPFEPLTAGDVHGSRTAKDLAAKLALRIDDPVDHREIPTQEVRRQVAVPDALAGRST